jgi:dTDP-4-amino-4,6-dideoxygalactose transaminase
MMAGSVSYKVPFIRPSFPSPEELIEDYRKIIESNWFTNFGPFEEKFAEQIGKYIGQNYSAVTFSSATAGLLASILAIVGKGNGTQYIIMPSFTFVAGADALAWCGYKPLFIDIELKGLHMDIEQAQAAIKKYGDAVVGVLFCNAFGVGAMNIEDWEILANTLKKPLIIDSAAGFGSLYSSDRKVGSAGDCEIFSFHATKPFAIGEGGAVLTTNRGLAEQLKSIQNFGFDQDKSVSQLGFNGKLQEISAAIGLRQLQRFSNILEKRRRIFQRYRTELNAELYVFQENAENASLCFATVLVKDPGKRNECLEALQKAGVDAKTYYSPSLHKQKYLKDSATFGTLSITELADKSVVSLPLYDRMNDTEATLIINTLNS